MSTSVYNFTSICDLNKLASAKDMRFGIAVAEWNNNITDKLLEGTVNLLKKQGTPDEQIFICQVPGSFELVYAAKEIAKHIKPDAIIVLGCVIRGDTPHFDYVCQGVTQGIATLNGSTDFSIPFIYGLVTTENLEQAEERAGGKLGNKGEEAAITAIKMVETFGHIKNL